MQEMQSPPAVTSKILSRLDNKSISAITAASPGTSPKKPDILRDKRRRRGADITPP
jgi:hypothetical protein